MTSEVCVTLLYGPGRAPDVIQGSEREVCIQTEELVRVAIMNGAGIGWVIDAPPAIKERTSSYLLDVGIEINGGAKRLPARRFG